MSLEELQELKEYNEQKAKLLLSRLGLDNRPLKYLFLEKNGIYTKLSNFDFVVNLLLLSKSNVDAYLIYKKEN